MNYDKAHDLAHAMRESEEYKELMAAQEAVKADAVATGLVRTFMAQQMQWEYAKLSGAPEGDESVRSWRTTTKTLRYYKQLY